MSQPAGGVISGAGTQGCWSWACAQLNHPSAGIWTFAEPLPCRMILSKPLKAEKHNQMASAQMGFLTNTDVKQRYKVFTV